MQILQGGPNIIEFVDIVRDPATKTPAIIEEFVNCSNPNKVWYELSPEEVKFFSFQLLRSLEFIHSKGIVYRDVKPHNALIDREKKILRLVDFGQAEFYIDGKEMNTRVSAINYKAPELLLNHALYDFSIDVWSFGCLFAGVILRKNPFFGGRDLVDQLVKICKVLGTKGLFEMAKEINIDVPEMVNLKSMIGKHPGKPLDKLVDHKNDKYATPEAIDLLSHLLVYNPEKRFSVKEAMAHNYFSGLN